MEVEMKLIKHGTAMRFVCEECGCEWQAVEKECKRVPMSETKPIYIYYCPECGHGATGKHIEADENGR